LKENKSFNSFCLLFTFFIHFSNVSKEHLCSTLRTDKSARIDLTENRQLEIKETFEIFDSDKSGIIDKHELRVAMRAMGLIF
jgi:Ca2+-binding EF-hand superfamily protein